MRNQAYIRNSILAAASVLAVAFGLVESASAQVEQAQIPAVTAANTSRSAGGRWEWTVFINASTPVLQSIRCVEYRLPSTSANPNRRVCALGSAKQPFAIQTTSWGTFEIPIRIMFKNGQTRTLRHKLSVK